MPPTKGILCLLLCLCGIRELESAPWQSVSRSGEFHCGDRKSNIQITEDMSRQDRQGWCELQRFMLRVMDRYPTSKVRLARERLTVDSRVFVWDRLSGKVEEQRVVTIPIQGDIVSSTNGSTTRY